jgi:hypothetical protein
MTTTDNNTANTPSEGGLRRPPTVFMVHAPDLDLQLRGTRAQVEAAFEAAGLKVKYFDDKSFRVHCTADNSYAYSRDDRRFYFVGPTFS